MKLRGDFSVIAVLEYATHHPPPPRDSITVDHCVNILSALGEHYAPTKRAGGGGGG